MDFSHQGLLVQVYSSHHHGKLLFKDYLLWQPQSLPVSLVKSGIVHFDFHLIPWWYSAQVSAMLLYAALERAIGLGFPSPGAAPLLFLSCKYILRLEPAMEGTVQPYTERLCSAWKGCNLKISLMMSRQDCKYLEPLQSFASSKHSANINWLT